MRHRGRDERPRPTNPSLRRPFAAAILVSATLLFALQPLTGKVLHPVLGGSPAVWSGCMVFFQAVLLLGYLYAHALSTLVGVRWQRLLHAGVLLAASVLLPLPVDVGDPHGSDPRWWMLKTLAVTVGLPFFALSATAPLLQRWFSRTRDPRAGDPYFLYAASNAGSLLGLIGYLAIEPVATRRAVATAWAVGFWATAALVAGCAVASARQRGPSSDDAASPAPARVTLSARASWIALALVPSALLLGVTQHLATDTASIPLLWVAPLVAYLTTLIAAFSARGAGSARRWGAAAGPAAVIVLGLSLAEIRQPILPVILIHLSAFSILAMSCHARLAEMRPAAAHLTDYFLCVALGGALGGAAVGLVAPAVFSSVLEYQLAIAAAILLRSQTIAADRRATGGRRLAWRVCAVALVAAGYWCVSAFDEAATAPTLASSTFAWLTARTGDAESATRVARLMLALPAVLLLAPPTSLLFAGWTAGLLVGAGVVRTGGDVIARERTFFGVHQVTSIQNGDWHVLTHGTTTHGVQAARGRLRSLPTAYYHPTGPAGDIVFTLAPDGRFRDVAVVGLGAGALAAYAGNGTRIDFIEVDDAVIRMAEDSRLFTYLADARARAGVSVRTIAGDGRLTLRDMSAAAYDLIVIDAFSSDAIPTHLMTREAVALYESRLKPRGLLAFHVSSRFFDLPPILARIAADRGLVAYVRRDTEVPPERIGEGMRASDWVVFGRDERDVGQLARSEARWVRLAASADAPLWTDDYSSVLAALR